MEEADRPGSQQPSDWDTQSEFSQVKARERQDWRRTARGRFQFAAASFQRQHRSMWTRRMVTLRDVRYAQRSLGRCPSTSRPDEWTDRWVSLGIQQELEKTFGRTAYWTL